VLVDPDDVEGWTAALARLLGDPRARERLGDAGVDRAAGFGRQANAAAVADVYRAALAL
jgi:glycosyltransferase involved in cell wall biosynthesis